jgi:glycosyltransferase involved in cell wall biosynthesis
MHAKDQYKPTILITMDWFDPAYKAGGPIQSVANMVKQLNACANFYIICSNHDLDGSPLHGISTNQWVAYESNVWVWYHDARPSISFYKKIEQTIKPDTLFVIGLFSFYYNLLPIFSIQCKQKIWSVRGMLHPGALRIKPWKKKYFLSGMRLLGVKDRFCFHATDAAEADFIRQHVSEKAKIFIAANFPKQWTASSTVDKQPGNLKLLTVALVSPMKNHLLVLEALAHCQGMVEYHLVGAVKDDAYWKKCLAVIHRLPANIQVIQHGDVSPGQVLHHLHQTHVSILPSESENYGHALIESLLVGRPIITSHHTPWNALQEQRAGLNVDTKVESLKKAIQTFIDLDNTSYQDMGLAAVRYAKTKIGSMDLKSSYQIMFNLPA